MIWQRLRRSMVRPTYLILHDASAAGQKEGKITVNAFKTALNIPSSDLDEKVAVASGGTSGYIWGTNGTDGVSAHERFDGVEQGCRKRLCHAGGRRCRLRDLLIHVVAFPQTRYARAD
jgi:hypothetical protein